MQIIDWLLFSDNKLLVCRRDVESKYVYKKTLIYETEKEYNKIDFVNNKFIRKTPDLFMEVDFINNTCKFDFGEEGSCKFDVVCEWRFKNDKLVVKYSIDEEIKKLEVIFKDLII